MNMVKEIRLGNAALCYSIILWPDVPVSELNFCLSVFAEILGSRISDIHRIDSRIFQNPKWNKLNNSLSRTFSS